MHFFTAAERDYYCHKAKLGGLKGHFIYITKMVRLSGNCWLEKEFYKEEQLPGV